MKNMNWLGRILRPPPARLLFAVLFFFLLGDAAAAFALDIATYLPFTAGNQWTYANQTGATKTLTIGSPVLLPRGVLAIPATTHESSQSSYVVTYSTLDSNGYRRHQEFMSSVYIPNYGYTSALADYSPAMVMAPKNVTVGGAYAASGVMTLSYANIGTYSLNYNSTTQVAGFETVWDSSGSQSWSALKVIFSMTVSGFINGQFFSYTSASTMWMAEGLGEVHDYSQNELGEMETWTITSTNVAPPVGAAATLFVPGSDDDGSYTVSWAASPTTGVSYTLEEATNSTFTSGLRTAHAGPNASAMITGRSSGTTYFYRVKATRNGYTDSPWTVGDQGCLVTLPVRPPATLSVSVPMRDGDGSYTVSWAVSPTTDVSYTLEEATNSTFTSGLRIAHTGPNTSATITGRSSGVTYYYRVKATRNGYTDSPWTVGDQGCLVIIPAAPAWISVPRVDADILYTIGWAASDTPEVSYKVEEASDMSFTSGLRTVYAGANTSVTLAGRVSGETYYYRVKTVKTGYADSAWLMGANGCLIQYPRGDMNGDGLLRLEDALLVLKSFTAQPQERPLIAADTDGDQRLSLGDACFILRYVAGLSGTAQ